jgi:hypothetical protein
VDLASGSLLLSGTDQVHLVLKARKPQVEVARHTFAFSQHFVGSVTVTTTQLSLASFENLDQSCLIVSGLEGPNTALQS